MSTSSARTNDPRQITASRKIQALRERERKGFYMAAMRTTAGRALVWDVLEECGVYQTTHRETPHDSAHASGRQDVGHWLMRFVIEKVDPALYLLMEQEARTRAAQYSKAIADALEKIRGKSDDVDDVDTGGQAERAGEQEDDT